MTVNTLAHFSDEHGAPIDLPVGKVFCVGRNYADHVAEMHSQIPTQPLLFIKPSTALVPLTPSFSIPTHLGACHNETELAFLVKREISRETLWQFDSHIWGVGLALDLTLRDIQSDCHPWERAKAFDGSCPISGFTPIQTEQLQDLHFSLNVNGTLRQVGHSRDMLFSVISLLDEIRQWCTLLPGDVVITGTPKGVGSLHPGDRLTLTLEQHFALDTEVTSWR